MRAFHLLASVALVGVCSLPATSDPTAIPSGAETDALTPIDSVPTLAQILSVAGPDPINRLRELALSTDADFGVRLRAIRAFPQFCTTQSPCKDPDANMHPARQAVREVIAGIVPTDKDGQTILRLRAAIESLGVIKSSQQSDVDLLIQFLEHPSRDIRAATARALRDLCLPTASNPLRVRYEQEPVAMVRLAISAALSDLDQCSL